MNFDEFIGAWRHAGFKLIVDEGVQTEPWLECSDDMPIYTSDGSMSATASVIDAPGDAAKHVAYCGPF